MKKPNKHSYSNKNRVNLDIDCTLKKVIEDVESLNELLPKEYNTECDGHTQYVYNSLNRKIIKLQLQIDKLLLKKWYQFWR